MFFPELYVFTPASVQVSYWISLDCCLSLKRRLAQLIDFESGDRVVAFFPNCEIGRKALSTVQGWS